MTVLLGDTVEVDVLANDTDPDGDPRDLVVLSSTTPFIGRAVRDGSIIRYTASNVPGPVTITYQVGDPDLGVATGRLIIRAVEPDPVALRRSTTVGPSPGPG
ncbi:MAG: Ig-like domain-containing protein [Ilumatobacteraceae bacterium]